ncbi:MAG: hypothetical protein OXI87_09285 [Albidovulum sp.]|nr:hypothetical protein [Albidovulum sp.]MDE0305061.1 hypothetical protein [Albidovulum sp.]
MSKANQYGPDIGNSLVLIECGAMKELEPQSVAGFSRISYLFMEITSLNPYTTYILYDIALASGQWRL